MDKFVHTALAVAVSISMLTAAWAEGSAEKKATGGDYGKPGSFPLAKELVLKGGIQAFQGLAVDINTLAVTKKLEKESNVKIEWTAYESMEKVNIIYAAGDYPDFTFSTGLWNSLITTQAALGVVLDLSPYLGKGIASNYDAMFARYPDSLAYSRSPDGRLNSLPMVFRIESNYLEQNFMINKVWLDKLGLKIPSTIAELKQVLVAFRDRDPNGNGKADELPFGFVAKDSFAQHLRSLYGVWGIPTKDGPIVRNGKVDYAAVQPEFKEFIVYMNDLHNEKLLDVESFTQNVSQFNAKVDDPAGPLYGFIIAPRGYSGTAGRDQYVSMPPPKAPGRQAQIWIHPGYLAIKNSFFITKRNPEPEYSIAWFDWLSDFERSSQLPNGLIGEGLIRKDGKLMRNPEKIPAWFQQNAFPQAYAMLVDANDWERQWIPTVGEAFQRMNYDRYYKQYAAKEAWNRPEFSTAEIKEVNTILPDLDALWKNKEAEWITNGKINAEWDTFVQQMKNMKLDRYIALCQGAYDRFLSGIKK